MTNEIDQSEEAKKECERVVERVRADSHVRGRTRSPFMREVSQKYIDGEITVEQAIEMAKKHHTRVADEAGPPF